MNRNKVSKTLQKQIIGVYLSGIRQRVISTQFGILTSTVNDIIKRYKETDSTEPKKCSGRPKVLTEHDTQALKYSTTFCITWSRVWRNPGETYNKDYIQPTVKFGGGSGCFSWHGVGPLVVVNSIFQQDGASYHTSTYSIWWMGDIKP
ncbi:hypothetical protein C1646_775173 [Rhizophagus diaphanus]|nr:hypothetical protein C1646_775173 [Rhizophagus diaphanus] [Rhizophagus sp. MUCL 43196]